MKLNSPQFLPDRAGMLLGLFACIALVIIIKMMTNLTPPVNDAIYYVDMAEHGVAGNDHLAAPFAYRPAVPMIVRALHALFSVTIPEGFRLLVLVSAVALLFLTFLFSRTLDTGIAASLIPTVAVAFSFFHIKFPLFLPTMVDIEASVLMLAAMWSLLMRNYGIALALSCVGLLFKEFLVIPPLLMAIGFIIKYFRTRSPDALVWSVSIIVAVGVCVILPRALLPIQQNYDFQEIHRFPPQVRLKMFLRTPLDYFKDANLIFSALSYWLPVLMLLTRKRIRDAWEWLGDNRRFFVLYLTLVFLLALYGGTNLMIFVTYSLAAQIMILAFIAGRGLFWYEVIYFALTLFFFNKLYASIPLPSQDFYSYIEFYGGWSSLLTPRTLFRLIELTGIVAGANLLRFVLRSRVQIA